MSEAINQSLDFYNYELSVFLTLIVIKRLLKLTFFVLISYTLIVAVIFNGPFNTRFLVLHCLFFFAFINIHNTNLCFNERACDV